ncbi:MAG: hypothetical protein EB116_20060 [Betaproteobacteria bacterium]|nr:hypothetical protein [Betaproteobacteria bacterium]
MRLPGSEHWAAEPWECLPGQPLQWLYQPLALLVQSGWKSWQKKVLKHLRQKHYKRKNMLQLKPR